MPPASSASATSAASALAGPLALYLKHARADIGVREDPLGSNDGPRVRQYLKATGLPGGYAWCAAFVVCIGIESALELNTDAFDSWPLPRSADCDVLLFKSRKLGIVHSQPAIGDLFFVMASPNDAIHTGIVTGINGDGSVSTIEGNSNQGGSRNGYIVASRPARRTHNLLFARWIDTVEIPTMPWRAVLRTSDGTEKPIAPAVIVDGYAYIPVRRLLQMLGIDDSSLAWSDESQGVTLSGSLLPVHVLLRGIGIAHGRVRQLAAYCGLTVEVDSDTRLIRVFRPK